MVKTKKISLFNIFNTLLFLLITLIVLLPILITVFASFKSMVELSTSFPLSLPKNPSFDNYIEVFSKGGFVTGFKNSFILVIASVIFNSLLSSMVAYCLSRFEFGLKKYYYVIFTLGMIIPTFMIEISRFSIIANNFGLYDTLLAPLIIYIGADLMQIYVFKQFIDQIPRSLDESAIIDGCSHFGVYWKVIFPIIIPATATLAILKAVDVLNDMYTPFLYMPSAKNLTLTTILMNNIGRSGKWTLLSAAVIIVMIPNIVIYLIFRRHILSGIVAGAVKE